MGVFFGTDGLRGVVNEDLSFDIAYKCGNALSSLKDRPKILIGSDTRVSNTYLTLGVAGGAMSGGATVIDVGVCPTAGIAYLTREIGADYGVVISASHNPKEYNGIKVFSSKGYKLLDKEEEAIERYFIHEKTNDFPNIGTYTQRFDLVEHYADFLVASSHSRLDGVTVLLDCANGASYDIAPKVFEGLGAKVICTNSDNNGMLINDKCGAVYPETLQANMKKHKADIGFAFDGDADRLIAVDDRGNIVNGDMLIYDLAVYLKSIGKLKSDTVVGTSHTNMAIERKLATHGITLVRTDIGDKYVLAKMIEQDLSLGGEQSGHIILKDVHTTGDGILSAIAVANMLKARGKTLSEITDVVPYPQTNINVVVGDKLRIINNETLSQYVAKAQCNLQGKGRVMVRASGTEPKIRVMVESEDNTLNQSIAQDIANLIKQIDK